MGQWIVLPIVLLIMIVLSAYGTREWSPLLEVLRSVGESIKDIIKIILDMLEELSYRMRAPWSP